MSALHYKTSASALVLLLMGTAAIFVLIYFVVPSFTSLGAPPPGVQSPNASTPGAPVSDALSPGAPAALSPGTPSSAAQETVSRLVALFVNWHGNKTNQAFSNQAARYIDYELMSSIVLGDDHWSKLSAAQQRAFIAAFRKLIEQRYYVRWHKIFKHGKVSYVGETSSSGQVTVKTEIAVKDERTVVNWKLHPAQGGYKVVSLTTDHRDLLEILRPRFGKVLSQHGFDGLMSWLNHKAVSSSSP